MTLFPFAPDVDFVKSGVSKVKITDDGIELQSGTKIVFPDATEMNSSAGISTDEKTKVSANDTTEGYLNGKLVAGAGVTFVEGNDGGNETLTISAPGTGDVTAGANMTDNTILRGDGGVKGVQDSNLILADDDSLLFPDDTQLKVGVTSTATLEYVSAGDRFIITGVNGAVYIDGNIFPTDDTKKIGGVGEAYLIGYFDSVLPDDDQVTMDIGTSGASLTGIDIGKAGVTVAVTGDITVTGTVDGRDVAADGTKLDGVEALADVTDAANVAAAGAVMDSDFSNKGDIIAASAASTPTNLAVGGDTFVLIADSGEVTGLNWQDPTNWDAAFTHVSNNGSDHGFIDQDVTTTGTPSFTKVNTPEIENAGNITLDALNAAANSTVFILNSDGTKTASLDVEFDITAGGGMTGTTFGIPGAITLLSQGGLTLGKVGNVQLSLANDTAEDSDGGRLNQFLFYGRQSGNEQSILAKIDVVHDGALDDEKGRMVFYVNDGNDGTSPTERLRIDSAGDIIINSIAVIGGDGEVNKAAVEDSGDWDSAFTHVSNDGSDHSFVDQDVTSGSSPTLDGTNFTGIPAADHGGLSGLSDDDHTQYALTDGSRDITGSQNFVGGGNIALGSATVDCGTLTMVKGAQTGDPQFQISLSADDAGDVTIAADTGAINVTLGGAATDDFTVDGTTFVVESDTSRVGIRTAAPATPLHIKESGNSLVPTLRLEHEQTGGAGGQNQGTQIEFYSENADSLSVEAGILDCVWTGAPTAAAENARFRFRPESGGAATAVIMTVDGANSGRVGISTEAAAPDYKLDVKQANSADLQYLLHLQKGGGAGGSVGILLGATAAGSHGKGAIAFEYTDGWSDGDLHFINLNGGNADTVPGIANKQLTIASDGGIYAWNLLGAAAETAVSYNTTSKELQYDTSSRRFKTNERFNPDTSWILEVPVKIYDRRQYGEDEEGETVERIITTDEVGIIAEDIAAIRPCCASYDENGDVVSYKSGLLVPAMLNELQKLKNLVDSLTDRIEVLEAK